jgi:tetratricopeptide (TPR) repeat protein
MDTSFLRRPDRFPATGEALSHVCPGGILEDVSMNKTDEARTLWEKGNTLFQQGSHTEALEHWQTALGILDKGGNQDLQASLWDGMAEIHRMQGQYDQAQIYYEKLLEHFQLGHDARAQAMVLNNMGLSHAQAKSYEQARDCFEKAYARFMGINDPLQSAHQLGNLGAVYRDTKAYPKAMDCCLQAYELYEDQRHVPGLGDQAGNIAYLFVMQGDADMALTWYRKALSAYCAVEDEHKAHLIRQNIMVLEDAF